MSSQLEKSRLFIAVIPDDGYNEYLHRLASILTTNPSLRASRKEGLHVTLLYLGEVPVQIIPEVVHRTDSVLRQAHQFILSGGLLLHNQFAKVGMLWMGFDRNDQFEKLTDELRSYLSGFGTWQNEDAKVIYNYEYSVAHIALAKKRASCEYPDFSDIQIEIPPVLQELRCRNIGIFESSRDAQENSSKFELLRRWELRKEGCEF